MIWLDSTFVIDFLYEAADHHDAAVQWMTDRSDAAIGTHPIVVFEVVRGTQSQADLERTQAFLQTLAVPPFDAGAAVNAGRFDRSQRRDGDVLSPRDTIIAAGAIEANATLVTRDRDFANVSTLDCRFYDDREESVT